MDELCDLVSEACGLIRRGEILPAHGKLHDVAAAARRLPPPQAKMLAPSLYAWLTLISDAADTSGVGGARLDPTAAAAFAGSTPQAAVIDHFERHFTDILDGGSSPQRSDPARVARAKRYMETCCREGARITIEDVARHVGCARSTLRATWRDEVEDDKGSLPPLTPTPSAYLKWCHVEAAKLALENKSLSIEDIAKSVGCSRRGLYDAFKKFEHVTPGEYRRRHRRSRRLLGFPGDAGAT